MRIDSGDSRLDGSGDGRADGSGNGRADGSGNGRVDGRVDGSGNGRVDGSGNGRVDGRVDGSGNGRADGRADGGADGRAEEVLLEFLGSNPRLRARVLADSLISNGSSTDSLLKTAPIRSGSVLAVATISLRFFLSIR